MSEEAAAYTIFGQRLSQGDIYAVPLVAPYADNVIRIFRGEHLVLGQKAILCNETRGNVYSFEDISAKLIECGESVEDIFGENEEMAVVYADLIEFFIIGSQTCDISGIDSPPKDFAFVLPLVPLSHYLNKEKVHIKCDAGTSLKDGYYTIVEILEQEAGASFEGVNNDPYELPERVRSVLEDWSPPKRSMKRKFKNAIREYINKALNNSKKYIYYLPRNYEMAVPDGIADFTRLFTLHTQLLEDLKDYRVATIQTPYKEDFSHKLVSIRDRNYPAGIKKAHFALAF